VSGNAWTPERRDAQREVARRLIAEGRFGGPGRGQGRRPKPRLALSWQITCPGCGRRLGGETRG
jgi:hypothetical protein